MLIPSKLDCCTADQGKVTYVEKAQDGLIAGCDGVIVCKVW